MYCRTASFVGRVVSVMMQAPEAYQRAGRRGAAAARSCAMRKSSCSRRSARHIRAQRMRACTSATVRSESMATSQSGAEKGKATARVASFFAPTAIGAW